MNTMFSRFTPVMSCLVLALFFAGVGHAAPSKVEVTQANDRWQLTVDGKAFPIKGAGGSADKALLANAGGNSFRTWGVDEQTQVQLDEAQELGLKVAVGIWLGHPRHGFDYSDPAQVKKQLDDARAAVMKYKDHPALLLWGVGNEMEQYAATTDPKMWKAVNDIAAMIQEVDPNHPTMTVIAEVGGDRLESIGDYCPAVDIVGINTYAGVMSMPERYRAGGVDKPYIVAEFGPPGTWEQSGNAWGVPVELTSTQKGEVYKKAYDILAADPLCLGSYAFTWGFKQESTATWFGMFLLDGTKTAAVDAMTLAWTGSPADNLCPQVSALTVVGSSVVEPGGEVEARLAARDPEGQTPVVRWVLYQEMKDFATMGDARPVPPTFPEAIGEATVEGVTVTMPDRPGLYRLFAFVTDGAGGGAVANVPLKVGGKADAAGGGHVNLPLAVYSDQSDTVPYVPSGYMGDHASIKMDPTSVEDPHTGATSLKVTFGNAGEWGGVVWQSPADDWGDRAGGYDLSGAEALSFWVRGAQGGEVVTFGFGLIGADKPFPDSGRAKREVTLTSEWQQITLPVGGRDMSCIKSGFYWSLSGQGKPVTFYLDDIAYLDAQGGGGEGGSAVPAAKAVLPLTVLGDDLGQAPWTPSGYMGDTDAIQMDAGSQDNPRTGKTATRVTYTKADGWGGVVWQHPVNDWGDKAGGHDLTGATHLEVWAQGAKGGEVVKLGLGVLGEDAVYPDTAKAEREVTLTAEWKAYRFELSNKDLSRIKTGLFWTVAGQGDAVTFYLDDVRYLSETPDEDVAASDK